MQISNCKLQNDGCRHRACRAEILHSRRRRSSLIAHRSLFFPAFTLVELLVVIAILSIVTIASIPMVIPALNSRAVREAARMVDTQLAAAQAQALADGRSAGVWFERLPGDPTGAIDMYLCQSPLSYSGDSLSSVATVEVDANATNARVKLDQDIGWEGLLKPGDLIRFSYSGPLYRFTGKTDPNSSGAFGTPTDTTVENPTGSGNYVLVSDNTKRFEIVLVNIGTASFNFPPAASSGTGWQTPYQINRQPVKSSSTPVQLPTGSVIDLAFSGPGTEQLFNLWKAPAPTVNQNQFADATDKKNLMPLIITFDRGGALEYIFLRGEQFPIISPLYLLIGKREKLYGTETTDTTQQNWYDSGNLWIGINPQSGLTSTAEAAATTSGTFDATTANVVRSMARSAQAAGGR